jgi:anti-sigma factor RsiW
MSRHATAEVLSAYLDDELGDAASRRLADHLEGCDDCRARLSSLRRVVNGLRRLERTAPPPVLAQEVERRLALSGRPAGRFERLEERLRGLPQSSSVFFTFALVVALAWLLFLFAHGVDRSQRPRTALVLGSPPTAPELTGEVRETRQAAGRTFDLVDGVWRQRGLERKLAEFDVDAGSDAGREILAVYPDLATLGDRILLQLEGSVVELRGVQPPPD